MAVILAVLFKAQLQGLDGLVLPGGESTTMGLVAERSGILDDLRAFVASKKPLFVGCNRNRATSRVGVPFMGVGGSSPTAVVGHVRWPHHASQGSAP